MVLQNLQISPSITTKVLLLPVLPPIITPKYQPKNPMSKSSLLQIKMKLKQTEMKLTESADAKLS